MPDKENIFEDIRCCVCGNSDQSEFKVKLEQQKEIYENKKNGCGFNSIIWTLSKIY